MIYTDPDSGQTIKALKNLEFLVVQELFLSETAKLADVVLPGAIFLEKDGTFTNGAFKEFALPWLRSLERNRTSRSSKR